MPDQDLAMMVQERMNAGDSEDQIVHAIKKYDDDRKPVSAQTLLELKGVAEGLGPGVWKAVKGTLYDLPKGVITGAMDIWQGNPPQSGKDFLDSITALKSLPKDFMDSTHEERGQMLGELLGSAGTAKFAPGAPRPAARVVGGATEQVGKALGMPLRVSGIYKAMQGNPLGVAMAAAPGAVQAGGRMLRQWGENEATGPAFIPGLVKNGETTVPSRVLPPELANRGVVPRGTIRLSPVEQQSARELMGDQLSATLDKAPGAKEKLADLDKSALQTQREGSTTRKVNRQADASAVATEDRADLTQWRASERDRIAAEKQATKDAEQAANNDAIDKASEGLEASKPSVSRSVSAPDGSGGTRTMRQTFKAADDAANLDPDAAAAAEVKRLFPGSKTPLSVKPLDRAPVINAPQRSPVRIAPDSPMQEPPTSDRTFVEPRPTRSKRGTVDPSGGLTEDDVQVLAKATGLNPELLRGGKVKVTPEINAILEEARSGRHGAYRTNGGLDAGFTRATEE